MRLPTRRHVPTLRDSAAFSFLSLTVLLMLLGMTPAPARAADTTPPVLSGTPTIVPSTIDVSSEGKTVRVEAHLVDDGTITMTTFSLLDGAGDEKAFAFATLSSGTAADGTWRADMYIPRSVNGVLALKIYAFDSAYNALDTITSVTLTVTGGDTVPPSLAGTATLDPTSINLGSGPVDVTVTVPVMDTGSGVYAVDFRFFDADSNSVASENGNRIDGTSFQGTWRAVVTVPANTPPGNYPLWVHATDMVDNSVELPCNLTLHVAGGDTTPPALIGTVSVDPASIDLSAGDVNVTIEATLSDASKIDWMSASLRNTNDEDVAYNNGDLVSGDSLSGAWRAEVTVPEGTPNGVYKVVIAAGDVPGNSVEFVTDRTVSVGMGDTQPPALSGTVTISPDTVDVSAIAGSVTVTAIVTDAQSGVSSVMARLKSGSSTLASAGLSLVAGGAHSGTWQGTVEIPVHTAEGTYALAIEANDAAGNHADLATGKSLLVLGGDTTPPALSGAAGLAPDMVNVAAGPATVEATFTLTDARSGVAAARAELRPTGPGDYLLATASLVSGDSLNGAWHAVVNVPVTTPQIVLTLWIVTSDHAGNETAIETDRHLAVTRDAEMPVTFRVDMRPVERTGVFRPDLFTSVYLDIFAASSPVVLTLSDANQDSIYEVQQFLPIGDHIRYAFAFDPGFSDSTLWLYELNGREGGRDLTLASGQPLTLPIVTFDDRPLPAIPPAAAIVTRAFQAGPVTGEFNDLDRYTDVTLRDVTGQRNAAVAVRRYTGGGGGSLPDGIVTLSTAAYWAVSYFSNGGGPVGAVDIPWDLYGGVNNPAALRWLHRDGPAAAWQVVTTTLDPQTHRMIATAGPLAGEWTIGSTSADNTLAPTPPDTVAMPNPPDGAFLDNRTTNFTFAWLPAMGALTYDAYLWPDGEPRPAAPLRARLTEPGFDLSKQFDALTDWRWQVVARNRAGDTAGPEWTFRMDNAPDLVIDQAEFPSEVFAGQEFQIRWVIRNTGQVPTSAAQWSDILYFSADNNLNTRVDHLLGFAANGGWLAPGESYATTQNVTIPEGVLPADGRIFIQTDFLNQLAESNEANNVRSFPITVHAAQRPDLRLTRFSAPDRAFSGQAITLSWDVTNVGERGTPTSDWVDEIYLSADSTLDLKDLSIGKFWHSGVLGKAEAYTGTLTVSLPDTSIGDRQLIIVTDSPNMVPEVDEGISNRASRPVTITLTPPPDLVPTSLSTAAGAADPLPSGRPVMVRWTVANQGPGAVNGGSWSDRISLAPRPGASRSDTVFALGSFPRAGRFQPDSSYVDSARVRIPDGIQGPWALRITTDWDNRIFEYQWEDNNASDLPVGVALSPSPDLVPAWGPLPAALTAGDQVELTWSVTNAGPDTARAAWVDRLYISSAAAWDSTAARVLAVTPRPDDLAPGARYAASALVRIPPELAAGTYYLYVRTDADRLVYEHEAEANNLLRSGAVSVHAFPVDLAVQLLWTPNAAVSGRAISLTWDVHNFGAGTTLASSWSDAVYLSSTSPFNPAQATALGDFSHYGALAGGESYRRSVDIRIPNGISGSYYLFVVTDAGHRVIESNENNNPTGGPIQVTLAPPADLRIESLDAPATAAAGQPLTVTRVVKNYGEGVTPAVQWYDGFYLSKNALRDREDIPLGTRRHDGALAAGESAGDTATIAIPAYAAGTYYLLAETDTRNDVYEHQAEGNNTAARLITIDVPPPTDLVVRNVVVDSLATPGDSVTVSWTLENHGTFPASGYMTEGVYISGDSLWTIEDPLVGLLTHRVEIAGGASLAMRARVSLAAPEAANADATVRRPLPGVEAGAYHAIVRTNIRNTIRETDLANNRGLSADSVLVGIPVLPLDQLTASTLAEGQARYWRIDMPESGRTLAITLTGDAASVNELFVRQGGAPTRSRFDLAGPAGFSPDQEIVVPSTAAGSYYVMAYGSRAAGAAPVSILAHVRTFSIDNVVPPEGGNGGEVTLKVSGSAIESDTDITLVGAAGPATLRPVRVKYVDPTLVYVTFDLTGAPLGTYNIHAAQVERRLQFTQDDDADTLMTVVTIPGEAVLAGAFRVVRTTPPRIDIRRTGTKNVRITEDFEVTVEATNLSNQDVRSPLLLVYAVPDYKKGVDPGRGNTAGPHLFLMTPAEGPAGTFPPGMTGRLHVTGTAPDSPVLLEIQTETVETTRYPFDFDRELSNAGVDPASSIWSEAIERLRSRPGGLATWSDYAALLAETASKQPPGVTVPHEAEDLLMLAIEDAQRHVLYPNMDDPIVPPDFNDFSTMAVSGFAAGPGEPAAPALPAAPSGAPAPSRTVPRDTPTPNCSEDRIQRQIALMTIVEDGMIHSCAPGGAYHIYHFLNGNGEPLSYGKDSYVAGLVRAHTNAQVSFSEIHREVAQQLRDQLEQYFKDAEDCSSPNSSPSFDLKPRKPSFYVKGKPGAIPWCSLPATELICMFGGMQRASAQVKKLDMNISPFRTCRKGCVVSYMGVIEYRFGDNYEFDMNDRKEGAYDRAAWNLQECGFANRYTTEIVMEEPVEGRITITEKDECPDPRQPPDDPWDVNVVASLDPNDMIGPAGVGDARWVARTATLPYTIRFENDPKKATAPAQVVTVTQTLDPHVDVRSFRLGRFGFGSFRFDVPPNSSFYSGRLDVRDSLGVYVDVNAGIDLVRGQAFWAFRSIDPDGGDLPANPLAGFLSVDDSLGHGQGFVSYTVRPAVTAVTGDRVLSKARIVFDLNEPIDTPEILNTIDADPPKSRVTALPATLDTTLIPIAWTGSDSTGSGVETTSLYWSRDDGPLEVLHDGITGRSLSVTGEYDHTYRFLVQTVDRTGNREPAKTAPETVVRLERGGGGPIPGAFAVSRNMPNPFQARTVIQFDLPRAGHVELMVFDSLGRLVMRRDRGEVAAGRWQEEIDMSTRASGVYFAELRAKYADGAEERRVRKIVLSK